MRFAQTLSLVECENRLSGGCASSAPEEESRLQKLETDGKFAEAIIQSYKPSICLLALRDHTTGLRSHYARGEPTADEHNILCTACSTWAAISKGEGCTMAFVIDRDCDGYGVGSDLGPDADGTDPSVNTAASALARYGTLDRLLAHLGYNPTRKLFIATDGDDRRGRPNEDTKPYATFAKVSAMLRAGGCGR